MMPEDVTDRDDDMACALAHLVAAAHRLADAGIVGTVMVPGQMYDSLVGRTDATVRLGERGAVVEVRIDGVSISAVRLSLSPSAGEGI